MASQRVIRLTDAAGFPIGSIDVSQIDHCNTQVPFTLTVETLCDQGEWHTGQRFVVDKPWGKAVQ
jgi:hypothetical protein